MANCPLSLIFWVVRISQSQTTNLFTISLIQFYCLPVEPRAYPRIVWIILFWGIFKFLVACINESRGNLHSLLKSFLDQNGLNFKSAISVFTTACFFSTNHFNPVISCSKYKLSGPDLISIGLCLYNCWWTMTEVEMGTLKFIKFNPPTPGPEKSSNCPIPGLWLVHYRRCCPLIGQSWKIEHLHHCETGGWAEIGLVTFRASAVTQYEYTGWRE